MKKIVLILLALLLCAGCAAEEPQAALVTAMPQWSWPDESDPWVDYYQDLTQSMIGYAGYEDSSLCKTTVELTNAARFDDRWNTYMLKPDANGSLKWESCNPLRLIAAVLNKADEDAYTFKGSLREGGPVKTVYSQKPDPTRVRLLVTDMMEQEGYATALHTYVKALFKADSHQQLYIAIVNSPFSGVVKYPQIEGEELGMGSAQFDQERPIAVIAAGPEAGIYRIRRILEKTGVEFVEFLVENRRTSTVTAAPEPGRLLQQNILLEDMTQAHCTVDLMPVALSGEGYAYVYRKVSADHTREARLVFQVAVPEKAVLTLGDCSWMCWQQVTPSTEPTAQEQTVPATREAGWEWVSCDAPAGIRVALTPLKAGSVIPGQTAAHSAMEDIVIPDGMALYELSMDLSEETAGAAYCLQAVLTSPTANPLASAASFERWDAPFALFGEATDNPGVLGKIPDLCLLLEALAALDAADAGAQAGRVQIVVQNYES